VFRSHALVPHAYRCTPSRGSAATRGASQSDQGVKRYGPAGP